MRRPAPAAAVLVAALALLGMIQPAGAITGGEPDAGRHPNVALVLFYQPDGRFRCTGTLVSPTVVLTAAHCTFQDVGSVAVTFDQDIALDATESAVNVPRACDDPGTGTSATGFTGGLCSSPGGVAGGAYAGDLTWVTGTALTHPDYSDFTDTANWNDTGVIVLDQPVALTPAAIAPVGYLDAYRQPALNRTTFGVVGYGTEVRPNTDGPQTPTPQSFPLIRRTTTSPGQKLTPQILQLNGNINDNRGGGGTCFGDSGGPVFHTAANGVTVLVADTSYGYTNNCRYLGGYQRLDIPSVHGWLDCVLGPDPSGCDSL